MKSDSYNDRTKMEEFITNLVEESFDGYSSFIPTRSVVENSSIVFDALKLENINSDASYMIKFRPDYLIINQQNMQTYFVDLKFSRAPLFARSRMNRINDLEETGYKYHSNNIGIIAREAYCSYKKYFPKMIIIYATPYNEKILMAQHIENIKPLYANGTKDACICTNKDF